MSVWDFLEGSRAADGIARQVAASEVAHAWLLVGPSGSGKRPAAIALAAAVNCPVQPRIGCGDCSTCTRIIKSRYPDVHHIVPEGSLIPVDVIRDVVTPEAARSPFEGAFKVFVIEEAERMNPAAQNALLKTLEEPQPDTIFVLISDEEEEVLETVRSRCRVVRLEAVSEKRVVELLTKYGTPETTAVFAARLSEGDYEEARAYATDEAVKRRRELWVSLPDRLVSPLAALDAAQEVTAAVRAAVKDRERDLAAELKQLEEEVLGGARGSAGIRNQIAKRHKRELRRLEETILGEALKTLASFYRDVVCVRSGASEAVTNLDLLDRLQVWADSEASTAALLRAADRCVAARISLTRNANQVLAVEATLVEISTLMRPPALSWA